MASPVTETVLIVAIAAFSVVFVGAMYLVYLARLGKSIDLRFSGYGISLAIGQTVVVTNAKGSDPERHDDKEKEI